MKLADLSVTTQDSVVIARIVGEIDMSNADELREALTAATPAEAPAIILDLTGVDYLDSAGIRMIYMLDQDVQVRRQQLQVVISRESMVADVLRLAGVSDHIGALDTVDEALSRVRGS